MTADTKPIDLKSLRSSLPAEIFELPRMRSFLKSLFIIAVIAALLTLGTMSDSVLGRVAIGLALGPFFFALASLGHEAGHRTASRWRFMNDLTGILTMSVMGFPSLGWKLKHDLHHRFGGVYRLDTDSDPGLEDYLRRGTFMRWVVRTFNRWEFLFWWAIPVSLWFTTWKYAFIDLWSGKRRRQRRTLWNVVDMTVAASFFAAAAIYTVIFGWTNLLLLVVIPFFVSGWIAAVTFVPNHRGMPPLTNDQARRAVRYSHVNSRTVLYPSYLPGNYFMNYVPWQIEHHIFPTIPGYRLRDVSPHLQAYALREGIPLKYETVFEAMPRVLRRDWLWGHGDGRHYTYAEAEAIRRQRLAAGLPPALPHSGKKPSLETGAATN